MSRTRRFIGGVGFGYANQILVTTVGLWLTPFLLGRVGQSDYGLWLVGTQILTYLTLLDFGIVALLPRATAYATGRAGSPEGATDLPDIIGQTARLTLWQMPFVALAAAIFWLSMPAEWGALSRPLGLVMVSFVVTFPLRVFQAVLQGLQDLAFLGKVTLVAWAVSNAITVALVYRGWGLSSLAVGWVALQLISPAVMCCRLWRKFPGVLPRRLPRVGWAGARAQLGRGFWVSVAQVAQVLVSGTDVLIIGRALGPLAVVPYACTAKLVGVLANQPQMLMQAAGPALSEMRVAESRHRLSRVCTALSQAMLLVSGGVVCVVLTVNGGFVGWWVGAEQYGGLTLSTLLLAAMLLRHWNTTAVYSIFCFGYERRISVTTLLDGAVTTCGAFVLVGLLGPVGAPLGTILGVCAVSLPLNLSALARETGVSLGSLVRPLWPWFWRFSALAALAGAGAGIFTPRGFLGVGATAALAALIYCAVMFPVALREPLGTYLRPRLAALRVRLLPAPQLGDVDV